MSGSCLLRSKSFEEVGLPQHVTDAHSETDVQTEVPTAFLVEGQIVDDEASTHTGGRTEGQEAASGRSVLRTDVASAQMTLEQASLSQESLKRESVGQSGKSSQ